MANPRYRASINGFWCHNETWDDVFNVDGKHDEVCLSVNTKVLDANGTVLDNLNSESELMGDTWRLPGRVQAGSASDRGGIVSGDKFPWDRPMVRENGLNTTVRVPPYLIWEGELPQGRMVFLTPTIWEWDPSAGAWDGWLTWQKQTDEKYGQRAKEIFGKIWPVSAPVFDAVSLGIQTFASLAGLWSPLGQSMRRPIGLQRDPANPNGSLFNPYTIALNSETAEYLVTSNPQGHGDGIRELLYVDDPYLRGVYAIFVQIEKLAGPVGPRPGGNWSGWAGLGGNISRLATAVNADGRLEVFAIGTDQALYHNWQTSPGGNWSGWAGLEGGITEIATAVNADGRLEVFAIGTDGALNHNWQTSPGGNWSGWAGLGGNISRLATAVNADGRLEVFAIGTDQALYHNWQTSPGGNWSGWAGLEGGITEIATAVNADGRLEVFAIGTDGALNHNWQTSPGGNWSGWAGLEGGISRLATAVNADGRLEVFAIGTDGALNHNWQTSPGGNWSGWAGLEGGITEIATAVNADGRLEVFAIGTDGALNHNWQTSPGGNWSGWAGLGGNISRLATAVNADGRLEVFAIGTDGALNHNWQA